MKNAFSYLKTRLSWGKNLWMRRYIRSSWKAKSKEIKDKKTEQNIQGLWNNYKRYNTYNGNTRGKKRNCINIWNNDWEVNERHQTLDTGSSENTKQGKCQKTVHRHIIFKLQQIKDREKILNKARKKKNPLSIKEQR